MPEEPPVTKGRYFVFYYYPDVEIYWNVKTKHYTMKQSNQWVEFANMPNVLNPDKYYVIIETGSPSPWNYHAKYKRKYPPYYPPKRKK